jgi:hypothetical protein
MKHLDKWLAKKQPNTRVCLDCSSITEGKNFVRCYPCKQQHKINNLSKYHELPKNKFKAYSIGAIDRGYVFDLSFEQFMTFWNKPCFYCNSEINTIGLDRVDNSIGYTLSNVVPCCITCNKMKLSQTKEEFINKCITIAKLHQE